MNEKILDVFIVITINVELESRAIIRKWSKR